MCFLSPPDLSHNTDIECLRDVANMQKLAFVLDLVKTLPECLQQILAVGLCTAHDREKVRPWKDF